MSALRIRDLCVDLDGRRVIDQMNLELRPGELMVLAGASGSGKTTLLRALAGLVPLSSGTIELEGRRIEQLAPGERGIAMMFQSHALFPHLNVADNLGFGLRARGITMPETRRRVEAVAEKLGLHSLLVRMPGELSGGERQRVALGRALLREARLFLMDEPLSSLDAPLRTRSRAELLQLHRSLSSLTLYVTHDQTEAMALADRLGVMEQGRILQLAPPREVYRAPASLSVARFIGVPTMNLLRLEPSTSGNSRWQELELPIESSCGGFILGLRPEQVQPCASRWRTADTTAPHCKGTVEAVEPLGEQQLLSVRIGDQLISARAEPELRLESGNVIELVLDLRGACRFDVKSGLRLAA